LLRRTTDEHAQLAEAKVDRRSVMQRIERLTLQVHLKELDLLGVTQYSTRTAGSEGGRKYFWELNTDLGVTIEVLGSIDRLDGVLGLLEWFTTHPGVWGRFSVVWVRTA